MTLEWHFQCIFIWTKWKEISAHHNWKTRFQFWIISYSPHFWLFSSNSWRRKTSTKGPVSHKVSDVWRHTLSRSQWPSHTTFTSDPPICMTTLSSPCRPVTSISSSVSISPPRDFSNFRWSLMENLSELETNCVKFDSAVFLYFPISYLLLSFL